MLVVPEALQLERVGGNESGEEEVLTAGVPNTGGMCVLLPHLSCEPSRPKMARKLSVLRQIPEGNRNPFAEQGPT